MAASDKVSIAVLLLMSMLSISHRGVSAQFGSYCSVRTYSCVSGVTGDDETICRDAIACIDALSLCEREEKDEAKKKLIEKGCVSVQLGGCCTVGTDLCVSAVTNDNLCKNGMACIDALSVCEREEKDEAKKKLIEKGFSGSGIPIISAMSLFVAALFHML